MSNDHQSVYADAYPYAKQGNGDASAWAIAAFCAGAFYALCSLTATLASVPLVRELESGETWDTVSTPVALVQAGSAVLSLLAMVGAYVATCLWLMQARSNALRISPELRQRHMAWLWIGWWLPIANLFMPFKVVRDVVDGSQSRGRYERTLSSAVLGWWWACWLVLIVFERVHGKLLDDVGTPGGASAGTVQTIAGLLVLVTVVGLGLWGLIIRHVVEAQNRAALTR